MGARSVVTLTTAPAGTGKSYRRCAHFIVTELLPETELKHLSNFPIQFESWQDGNGKTMRGLVEICKLRSAATEDEVLDRIELIPEAEMNAWRDGISGPWNYFKDKDLSGYHLAIDEIHNFCGLNTHREIKKKWQEWLGELRHRGARIEFISQHPQKIAKEIRQEAEILLELEAGENDKDPIFGIPMSDWYNLRAKITGKYTPCVIEVENKQIKNRWKVTQKKRVWFGAELFEVYDSFSTPVQGGSKGMLAKEPWQRLSWFRFSLWFVARNLWQLFTRFGIATVMLWLGFFGGGGRVMASAMEYMRHSVEKPKQEVKKQRQFIKASSHEDVAGILRDVYRGQTPQYTSLPVASVIEPHEPITEEEIQEKIKPWALSAITAEGIWFANGEFYLVGEVITEGPYSGKTVERVDLNRRRVYLDSIVVRLRSISSARLREYATTLIRESRQPEIQRLLPASSALEKGAKRPRPKPEVVDRSF